MKTLLNQRLEELKTLRDQYNILPDSKRSQFHSFIYNTLEQLIGNQQIIFLMLKELKNKGEASLLTEDERMDKI